MARRLPNGVRALLLACAAVGAGAALAVRIPPAQSLTSAECAAEAASSSLAPATFDALWTRQGPGWTGGDGARSLRLADGRVLWLFGDTLLGRVDAAGRRSADSALVRNAVVVQDGACLTTHTGGTDGDPDALVPAPDPDHWMWPGDGAVHGERIHVVMSEFESRPNGWFEHQGDYVVVLSGSDLGVESRTRLRTPPDVMWGESVLVRPRWTYVYGIELGAGKSVHIARAPSGRLPDVSAWRFYDGFGWSADPRNAAHFTHRAAGADVVAVEGGYVLMHQHRDAIGYPTSDVFVHRAPQPIGPWTRAEPFAEIPALAPGLYSYGALAHPAFTERNTLLVGYSVNAFQAERVFWDASAYRPRFLAVPLGPRRSLVQPARRVAADADGRLALPLACRADRGARCRGTVRLHDAGQPATRQAFDIAGAHRGVVSLRLGRRDRPTLHLKLRLAGPAGHTTIVDAHVRVVLRPAA